MAGKGQPLAPGTVGDRCRCFGTKDGGWAAGEKTFGRDECMEGQIAPKPYVAKDDSEGEKLLELLNEVYNRKMINRVTDFYAENAIVHTVGNKDLVGYDEIQGAIISLLASFPNARLVLERVTCNK